jgi:DNA topoisomerase I
MASGNKTLVVVESPSKAKTINKYLGNEYKVTASVGHIIDLPKTKFGVNIEDGFKPQYIKIRGKEKIIKELKENGNKASQVLIATDPDREGEAIAYHIYSIMDHDKTDVKRVEFNEITKSAVDKAIKSPRPINMDMVYSQQARRVLDRIVGYEISPVLWKTVYRGLSAGRVQSVALRLICEREQEIREFKPEEFWTIEIDVKSKISESFKAKLIKINESDKKKFIKADIKTESEASNHVQNIKDSELYISLHSTKQVKKHPVPPFITSTLQQAAARVLRFSTSRIMRIAQQLYEGVEIPSQGSVGLITYMRTDSTRIGQDALNSGRKLIDSLFGKEYLPEKPNFYKSKKSAQDAHEAIRPTYLSHEYHPEKLKDHLTADQYKLYSLIWKRFIASQMKSAIFDKTVIEITAGNYLFRVEGEVLTFEGFLKVYGENLQEDKENDENGNSKIPPGLKENDKLELLKVDSQQNFTKPPARFSESTLVKELDKQGIGRPSTYAQIITTIISRKYVEKNENKLFATELGETVNSILVKHFPKIFNVKFTAEMETELDKIATNDDQYESVLNDFYSPFKISMEHFNSQKDKIKSDLVEKTDQQCEKCGKPMIARWGRNGKFLACSGYPECKNTKPIEEEAIEIVKEKCEKCGNSMVVKTGRFGRFLACSNYPTCKNAKPIPLGIKCPKDNCNGDIIQRKTKKGRTFYGCSNYPKCDFVSWNKPVNKVCSNCKNNYLLEKYSKAKGNFLECPECKIENIPDKTST